MQNPEPASVLRPDPGWKKVRAVLLGEQAESVDRVFGAGRLARLDGMYDLVPGLVGAKDLAARRTELADVEIAFSTWGSPVLSESDLALLPSLKAHFYAAGSVKAFAEPQLRRGIRIFSAWQANAIPVAETTVAHVILALKQTLQSGRAYRRSRSRDEGLPPVTGTYGSVVGLISLGAIGRLVARMLEPYAVRVIACDPFVKTPPAGVEMVELDELFRIADVVSLHAPWIPATEGMITGAHLASMKPHATFLNTSRGALVREAELIEVLERRPDLQAILDVTWPEPPVVGSPFYTLENVLLTPHIAGSAGNETLRMADWMIEESGRFLHGDALRYEVSLAMLPTMA